MTRKGFGFIYLKDNMISMIPNIAHNYVNFFHRVIEQLVICCIVFISHFQLENEVSLIKE